MLMLPSSCRVREIWASLSGRPSLPDRQGRTISHRWVKKALTGARKRLFNSWEEENKNYLAKVNKHWSFDFLFLFIDCLIVISVYLRPLFDGCWVHDLLPHAVHVCQEDVIRRFTKPALGEQLAAADAHRKPGTLQEDLRGSFTGLHHGPETRIQTEMLNREERFRQY